MLRPTQNMSPKRATPKSKHKSNRPMRGLVFGHTDERIKLSESGKRLRIEKEVVGRNGGVFANDLNNLKEMETEPFIQQDTMVNTNLSDPSEVSSRNDNLEMENVSPDVVAACTSRDA